jgi:hemoglobin
MNQTLYDKYGGFGTIAAVVAAFYDKIAEEDRLTPFFKNTDMAKLLDHQTKFLCKVLGGPDNYEGRSLKPSHAALKIDQASFMLVGSLLQQTLEEAGVEAKDVGAIMAIVISVKDEIISVRAAA